MPSIYDANSHERGPTQNIFIKEQIELRRKIAELNEKLKTDPKNDAFLREKASLQKEVAPIDENLLSEYEEADREKAA